MDESEREAIKKALVNRKGFVRGMEDSLSGSPKKIIGMHVRLLPDAYVRLLIPPNKWTGTIDEVRQSERGNPTEYLFHLDEQFQEPDEETEFYVREEEIERCEP